MFLTSIIKWFDIISCLVFKGDSNQNKIHQKCKTIGGPANNKHCVFPFRFRGIVYNGCAHADYLPLEHKKNPVDSADKVSGQNMWCSTKVNHRTGNHLGGQGNWGICSTKCPKGISLN